MPSTPDPLTLSRQDLYELAWSKPLVELAQDLGLSDVALAKRCRKLGIPVPGRGYWARVAAGQSPRKPPLKGREEKPRDYSALTFHTPQEPEDPTATKSGTPEELALRERIVALAAVEHTDHRPQSPAIKRTAVLLKRPWRSDIPWRHGEKSGPVAHIDTSELVADRALRLADALIVSASQLDWPFQAPKTGTPDLPHRYRHTVPSSIPVYGYLIVQGERLGFRIDERSRQVKHVPTDEEKQRHRRDLFINPPRWDYVPTGELQFHLLHPDYTQPMQVWKDSAKHPLEHQITKILIGFLDEALRIKTQREEQRREQIEQQRQEDLKRSLSHRRSQNAKLIHELERQSGAWHRARILRAYLRALKRTLGERRIEAMVEEKPIDFFSWAEHYVDQLDPLSPTAHDPDLMEDSLHSYGADDAIRQMLSRLMGRDWQEARMFRKG